MKFEVFAGCDMAKSTFHYCIRTRDEILKQGEVKNNQTAIRSWMKSLKRKYKDRFLLLGLEHTGLYNAIFLRVALDLQMIVCVESARQIKLSLGMQRGKNDKVDAARIAEYMMRYEDKLRMWKPKREVIEKLAALLTVRNRLVKMRKQLSQSRKDNKHFMPKEQYALIAKHTKGSLEALSNDEKGIERQIQALIRSDDNLKRLFKLVTSVKGVGKVTAWEFIVRTNEFLTFDSAKQIACMAGVAPFEHRSGTSIKGRTRVNHQANKRMKTLLHMCAMSAVGSPGFLQEFYDRKLKEGKNKMTALNAVRNKLVHRIFAVVRDNVMYEEKYLSMVA